MASNHQFLNHTISNQVQKNPVSGQYRHGCSKAQICLHKIMDLIISSRAPLRRRETSKQSPLSSPIDDPDPNLNVTRCENRASSGVYGFDLNIAPDDTPDAKQSDSAYGNREISVIGNCDSSILNKPNSEGECDLNSYGNDASDVVKAEESREISEITNLQFGSSEIDNNGVSEESVREENEKIEEPQRHRSEGYFGLLIEAANLIFGETELVSEKPSQSRVLSPTELITDEDHQKLIEIESDDHNRGSKRDLCSAVDLNGDFEEVSPAVKRGRRSQVLPFRYRDSVLEPLTRLSRQRSTIVSAKRKSR